MTGGILLALVKALPQVLALINTIAGFVKSAQDRGIGRDQAVAEALALAAAELARAQQAREAARAEHARTRDDTAFDGDFERRG